jgi:rSAM/selenodomain-associated transferase 2
MAAERLSVILPVLNEASTLPAVLARVGAGTNVEAIAVDGGSADATPSVARDWGADTVLSASGGRARQMNAGAAAATGAILLFLHADTRLPAGYDALARDALAAPAAIAGAFPLAIAGRGWGLRLVEAGVNGRSRWCALPYGDQALFLKTSTFWALGGFPELPIMEDFELVRRLRQRGRIALAPAPVVTSGRRWQQLGVVQTTLINQAIIAGYVAGISPQRLRRWYRGGY